MFSGVSLPDISYESSARYMNIKISTYRQLRRYLRVSWIHGPPIQPVHETIDFRGQGIGQVIYPLVEHLQLSRERERGRKGGIKCQDQPACESCTNSSTFTVETLKSVFSQSKGQYAPQIAALQLHTTSKMLGACRSAISGK